VDGKFIKEFSIHFFSADKNIGGIMKVPKIMNSIGREK